MIIPKTGITTTVVKNVLGISTNKVSELCTSDKINMWSRMKPVHILNTPFPNRLGMWWKGSNSNAGINLPEGIVNYNQIPEAMTPDNKNGWGYERPSGKSFSPYRLADFMEYKSDALPPIHAFSVQDKVEKDGILQGRVMVSPISSDKTGPGSVTLDDIRGGVDQVDLGNYYLGMLITDSGGTILGRVVGGKGTDKLSTDYSVKGLTVNKPYMAYPFLARVPMGQYETDMSNTYYTLPNSAPYEFIVSGTSLQVKITLTAKWVYNLSTGTPTGIRYEATVMSLIQNMLLVKNVVQARFSRSKPNDIIQQGEEYDNLADISLVKNVPQVLKGEFIINEEFHTTPYYIYISLQTGKYTARVVPMMEAPDR